jgi:DNA-damage-inducible protein J
MSATATVQARIEPKVKKQAEKILSQLGMTTGDAIRIMMHQVIAQRGYPIDLKLSEIPNAMTQAAMRELDEGKGEVFETPDKLFASWKQ